MNSDTNDKTEGKNWDEEVLQELKKIQQTEREEEVIDKIRAVVKARKEVEEAIRKENGDLRKKVLEQKSRLDEMEMERDVLLQQIHAYLEMNSSLRIRLEEQRCQTGALKRQLNGDLETRIRMLEQENLEKDKEVDKMKWMLEVKKRKENDVTALRKELKRALEDKMKAEGSLREVLTGRRKRLGLRRSVSAGDVGRERLESMERNIILEGPREGFTNVGKLREKVLRTDEGSTANYSDSSGDAEKRKKELPEASVHVQLDALKRGLFNVTRKLEFLKTQLISSGTIKEETQRSLKRKAETESSLKEESKTSFKNLKSILEDAKTLNAKLDSLREEKQKLLESKKEKKGTKSDVSSQTTETRRHFEKTMAGLKEAVAKCEEEVEKGLTLKEEAYAAFISALIVFILSNLSYFSPNCRNMNVRELLEGVKGSKENGGGDNILKIHENPQDELKAQLARLKVKIQVFENFGVL